jgi:RND family efflux transporter MFP subunit
MSMTTETTKPDLSSLRIKRDLPDVDRKLSVNWKLASLVGIAVIAVALFLLLQGTFSAPMEVEATTVSLTYPSQANAVLTASGYVVAQQKASIASKATGRLVYLGVEEGDKVGKGQVIARIEDQDVLAALNRAKAELEVARADSHDASQSYERQKRLNESGLSSKAELDAAEARLRRVEAAIKSAAAAVVEAEVALENTRIRAPFDGTVLTKDADVGEVVAPFASSANSRGTVVTLADMSSLEVEADVSESNITRVGVGQPCEIILDAYPEVRYPGFVHKIVPTADRAKATVLTKVHFKERDARVLPEMSAKVTFLSKESKEEDRNASPTLSVISSAVVNRNGQDVVYLIQDDVVQEVPVKTGAIFGDRIEIREGLALGDKIVLRPNPSISNNSKIRLK